jgi:hypothetical protein
MTKQHFPVLDLNTMTNTRDALHAYSRVLGAWCKKCHPRRKHWWHASLRPSLYGLTTGVMYSEVDIELELKLNESSLVGRNSNGEKLVERLVGQPASTLASVIQEFMVASGVDENNIPQLPEHDDGFRGYSVEHAYRFGQAINAVSGALDLFRGSIPEETSPIQLWPHHFDLSMLWLAGEKIPGQDPDNEEYSDKQMNFGFAFGDETISEPYFYVTAYPLPETLSKLPLPAGAQWRSEGFSGAVVLYKNLLKQADPKTYLVKLWSHLLAAGREQMLSTTTKGV